MMHIDYQPTNSDNMIPAENFRLWIGYTIDQTHDWDISMDENSRAVIHTLEAKNIILKDLHKRTQLNIDTLRTTSWYNTMRDYKLSVESITDFTYFDFVLLVFGIDPSNLSNTDQHNPQPKVSCLEELRQHLNDAIDEEMSKERNNEPALCRELIKIINNFEEEIQSSW